MVHPAAIHPLTPGSPAYAMLKVGAIGSVVALRFALTRRKRGNEEAAAEPPPRLTAQRFGCQSAISPPAGVAMTLRHPTGPSRGSSRTPAPAALAPSVAVPISATST